MAESDPNADAVLARIEAALARVAALAAQKNDMALAAQRDAARQGAHKDTAALAAGLDRVIARLRAALAETGG